MFRFLLGLACGVALHAMGIDPIIHAGARAVGAAHDAGRKALVAVEAEREHGGGHERGKQAR